MPPFLSSPTLRGSVSFQPRIYTRNHTEEANERDKVPILFAHKHLLQLSTPILSDVFFLAVFRPVVIMDVMADLMVQDVTQNYEADDWEPDGWNIVANLIGVQGDIRWLIRNGCRIQAAHLSHRNFPFATDESSIPLVAIESCTFGDHDVRQAGQVVLRDITEKLFGHRFHVEWRFELVVNLRNLHCAAL
jgi:hypothetical protein